MDKEMPQITDAEVMKALPTVLYGGHSCRACKYRKIKGEERCGLKGCYIARQALDLTNRQQAKIAELEVEIGRLEQKITYLRDINKRTDAHLHVQLVEHSKSEAYREFAERLKTYLLLNLSERISVVTADDVDKLLKELTRGEWQ